MRLRFIWAALLALMVANSSSAEHNQRKLESESLAQTTGVIVDWQDARITDAFILFEGKNFRREIRSDGQGEFSAELPTGSYRVTIRHPTFKTRVIKALKVSSSIPPMLKIRLQVKMTQASGGKCPKGQLCL